jgi:hypothetical protein
MIAAREVSGDDKRDDPAGSQYFQLIQFAVFFPNHSALTRRIGFLVTLYTFR